MDGRSSELCYPSLALSSHSLPTNLAILLVQSFHPMGAFAEVLSLSFFKNILVLDLLASDLPRLSNVMFKRSITHIRLWIAETHILDKRSQIRDCSQSHIIALVFADIFAALVDWAELKVIHIILPMQSPGWYSVGITDRTIVPFAKDCRVRNRRFVASNGDYHASQFGSEQMEVYFDSYGSYSRRRHTGHQVAPRGFHSRPLNVVNEKALWRAYVCSGHRMSS